MRTRSRPWILRCAQNDKPLCLKRLPHRGVAFFERLANEAPRMHPFRRAGLSCLAVVLIGLGASCGTTAVTPANPQIPETSSTAQLRPGDSLNIALQGV